MRSWRMPSLVHQTPSAVSPVTPVAAKGGPELERITSGSPYSSKARSNKRPRLLLARAAGGRHAHQVAAEDVGHRQRLAAPPVAEPHPALVIDRPDMVRPLRRRQRAQPRRRPPHPPPPVHQPGPLQDLARRRGRRPDEVGMIEPQPGDDLARPPARPRLPQLHDQIGKRRRRRPPVRLRRPRALHQAQRPFRAVAADPLVARRPADPVVLAQRHHRPLPAQMVHHEAHPLIHRTALVPRHRPVLPAIRELSTIHPVYSVSDLSGSHTRARFSPRGRSCPRSGMDEGAVAIGRRRQSQDVPLSRVAPQPTLPLKGQEGFRAAQRRCSENSRPPSAPRRKALRGWRNDAGAGTGDFVDGGRRSVRPSGGAARRRGR